MNLSFSYPWVLALLPLALLPWINRKQDVKQIPSLWLIDSGKLSGWVERLLQTLAMLLILSLILAIATPYFPQQTRERTGQGAEIILLLDRSRSMDQPFVSKRIRGLPVLAMPKALSKGTVARTLLSEFVAARENDRFGMVVFSSRPIQVLPLTNKQDAVLAAIAAGGVGRGLAETDITSGVMEALKFFDGMDYRGSRIVVLISDGASELRVGDKARLIDALKRLRVSFYWIYIRSRYAVDLFNEVSDTSIAPQQEWHRFFTQADIPYRVFTAEDPQGLEAAIADINRLQNLPILYQDIIPGKDLAKYLYRLSLVLLISLLFAQYLKDRWRNA